MDTYEYEFLIRRHFCSLEKNDRGDLFTIFKKSAREQFHKVFCGYVKNQENI